MKRDVNEYDCVACNVYRRKGDIDDARGTMNWVTVMGFVAGTCTTISFLPQVIKIVKTRRTEDISLGMYVVFCTGVFLWGLYGVIHGDLPIIVANVITFLLAVTILALKVKHG